MSNRKHNKTTTIKRTTKISKSNGEYCVQLFEDGVYVCDGDYFTDDWEDAKASARSMERNGYRGDGLDLSPVDAQFAAMLMAV